VIPIKIAVDAFGGDFAPEQIVEGALQAADMYGISVILTGDQAILEKLINNKPGSDLIEIVHCSEKVDMDEEPIRAVRSKKDSSLVVAANLVKQNQAVGLVSAGNTGATMAAALFGIGRIKGIERPAITPLMPTLKELCLIVDAGANVDCRPSHLVQFAQMGSIYAKDVLGINNPRIGLLNIGEEPSKGNEVAIKTYELLGELDNINFIGNIEARDIPKGEADVVVCDGFVGNSILKFAEGLGSAMFNMLAEQFTQNLPRKLAAGVLRPGLSEIKKKLDYTEYGGAPLLGVKGAVIIAHGGSNAKAIRNAIRVCKEAAESQIVNTIAQSMVGD